MGSNDTKYAGVAIYSRFVLYRRFYYRTIMTMMENRLVKNKVWNETWYLRLEWERLWCYKFPSAVLFRKFTYWQQSLKEETCGQRFSRLCRCPWNLFKYVKREILSPRNFSKLVINKSLCPQNFEDFNRFCNYSSYMLKFWKFSCRR